MKYIIGVDGGGTKTVCVLMAEDGRILSAIKGEGSNHQICGLDQAVHVIADLIHSAVRQAGIQLDDISFIGLGLAGADQERDIQILSEGLSKVLAGVPFEIVNDIWIAFWAGSENSWGAVSVCGTGSNTGVRTPEGRIFSVRALRYILGNYGGGKHLSDIALHYAFRSNEHTGRFTKLEEHLPAFCRALDMDDLAMKVLESGYTYHYQFDIPKLVFELADDGDEVCREILWDMGWEMGTMTGGLIEVAGLAQAEEVPVVLAGSLYVHDENGFIINGYEKALRQKVKSPKIHVLRRPPVQGALFWGLQKIGVSVDRQKMDAEFNRFMGFL